MARSRNSIIQALESKGYRSAYVRRIVPETLALQIRNLRGAWSQAELGNRAGGMKQATISRLENPDNDSYTIGTLTRLADAFDVALVVHFAPFSELVDWATSIVPGSLDVPNYSEDSGLREPESESETTMVRRLIASSDDRHTAAQIQRPAEEGTAAARLRIAV